MSIHVLIRGKPTLTQLEILQRADCVFRRRCGRYFGGFIQQDELEILTNGLNVMDTERS